MQLSDFFLFFFFFKGYNISALCFLYDKAPIVLVVKHQSLSYREDFAPEVRFGTSRPATSYPVSEQEQSLPLFALQGDVI